MGNYSLLEEIELFLVYHGMAATAFGQKFANSGQLVHAMRLGRKPRERLAIRLRERMDAYAKQLASEDAEIIEAIRKHGCVMLDSDERAYLKEGREMSRQQFERLLLRGYIKPSGDSMFGVISQTFLLST